MEAAYPVIVQKHVLKFFFPYVVQMLELTPTPVPWNMQIAIEGIDSWFDLLIEENVKNKGKALTLSPYSDLCRNKVLLKYRQAESFW